VSLLSAISRSLPDFGVLIFPFTAFCLSSDQVDVLPAQRDQLAHAHAGTKRDERDRVSILNECSGQESSMVAEYARRGNVIGLALGGLGVVVPRTASVKVRDLGDCSGDVAVIYTVTDYPISNQGGCISTGVAFP
jgi:hypothetical protein